MNMEQWDGQLFWYGRTGINPYDVHAIHETRILTPDESPSLLTNQAKG